MLDRIRAALLVTALLLAGCSGMAAAQSGGTSLLGGALPSFAPLVKRVVPAVVNIAVTEDSGPTIAQLPPAHRSSGSSASACASAGSRSSAPAPASSSTPRASS